MPRFLTASISLLLSPLDSSLFPILLDSMRKERWVGQGSSFYQSPAVCQDLTGTLYTGVRLALLCPQVTLWDHLITYVLQRHTSSTSIMHPKS